MTRTLPRLPKDLARVVSTSGEIVLPAIITSRDPYAAWLRAVDMIKSFRKEFRLTYQDFAAVCRREANYLVEESRPAETTLDVMTLIAARRRLGLSATAV